MGGWWVVPAVPLPELISSLALAQCLGTVARQLAVLPPLFCVMVGEGELAGSGSGQQLTHE